MANRYWVGGTGNWSDAANHWSNASGGTPSASYLPTSADNVLFNNSSSAGAFTVTVDDATATCANFDASGITNAANKMTFALAASAGTLTMNGSWTNPTSTYFAWTASGSRAIVFAASGTITTNAVSFLTSLFINGSGITVSLNGAFSSTSGNFILLNGAFDTDSVNSYSVTHSGTILISNNTNTRSLNLNASTVSIGSASNYTDSSLSGFTLNAGTSTITMSNPNATFTGGGKIFYNVSFTSNAAGTVTINGANTYNNLTFTSRTATGLRNVAFAADQTVSGTLTLGAANTAIRRMFCCSSVNGTQRTLTVATFAATTDVDFRDIAAAGASVSGSNWNSAGTGRFGDCKGNNNKITFDTSKIVYWNLAGTQNWSATGWATTNNGVPSANNFPLAQDTATFTEAGAAGTVTVDLNWNIGVIQMADGVSNRATAFTLATGTTTPVIYGNVTLFSNLTLSGTGALTFAGQGITQTIVSAGRTFTQPWTINAPSGTVALGDNTSLGSLAATLTAGTLNVGGYTFTLGSFVNTGTSTRAITFNSGTISLSGSGATVWNASGAGFTTSAGSGNGTITLTSASAKTFVGGGYSYAATLNQGGAGALTVAGSNTFYDITATSLPSTITFTAGTTQSVTQFTASGTSGNLLTLNSSSAGSQFILSDASGTNSVSYCSIKDSRAIGGATWLAYTTNGNVNDGNNSYWQFATPVVYSYSSDVKLRSLAQRGRF